MLLGGFCQLSAHIKSQCSQGTRLNVRHVQRFHGFVPVTRCPLLLPMRNLQVACALSFRIIGLREKGESNPPLILLLLARCSVYGSFSPRCPCSGAVRVFPRCQRGLLKGCGRPLVILGFSGVRMRRVERRFVQGFKLSRIRGETPCAASLAAILGRTPSRRSCIAACPRERRTARCLS